MFIGLPLWKQDGRFKTSAELHRQLSRNFTIKVTIQNKKVHTLSLRLCKLDTGQHFQTKPVKRRKLAKCASAGRNFWGCHWPDESSVQLPNNNGIKDRKEHTLKPQANSALKYMLKLHVKERSNVNLCVWSDITASHNYINQCLRGLPFALSSR